MMKRFAAFTLATSMLCALALPAQALVRPSGASYARGVLWTVSDEHTGATLTNFPVLVRITDGAPAGFSYTQMQSPSTGDDLCFVDMNGNGLPFEIDTWNTNGTSLVWVQLPEMTNSTTFVMCWGSATSGKTVCGTSPWDSSFKGVWHMNSTSPADETGNGNGGTSIGSLAVAVGKVGSAVSFSGSSTGISCGTSLANTELKDGFTVEGWANSSNYSGNRAMFGKKQFISVRTDAQDKIKITTPGVKDHDDIDGGLPATGNWFHFALSFQPGSNGLDFYVNGSSVADVWASGFKDSSGKTEMYLGYNEWNQCFAGLLDEMRLSAGIRSADWLAASYATQSSATFLTAGTAEAYEATAEPVVGLAALDSDIFFTNATLTVSVGSLGMDAAMANDATSVDLRLVVSTSADLSDPAFSLSLGSVSTAPASVSVPLVPLSLNTTYYAQLFATNNLGSSGESSLVSFQTRLPAPEFTAAVNMDRIAPDISLSFTDSGWGPVTRITVQVSTTEDFGNPAVSKSFTVNLATMPTNVSDFALSGLPATTPLCFRFIAKNSNGYESYVDLSVASSVDGDNVWSGLSENIADSGAYVFAGGLPASGNKLYFTTPAGLSPVVNDDTAMPALYFTDGQSEAVNTSYLNGYHSCGYDLSGSGILSFTVEKPIVHASYGTNVISNPILFSRANTDKVTILSVGENNAWLMLNGDLMLPDGVTNTTMHVNGLGNTVLGGSSPDFMGQLFVQHARLTFANPFAMTNVSSIFISGDPACMSNAIGAPLVFPRVSSISVDQGWGGRKLHLYGAPFVFPQATFEWGIRDYGQSTFDADFVVSNVVVRKHGSNGVAVGTKTGAGTFIVTGKTTWYDSSVQSSIELRNGCFWPQTSSGLPPSGEFFNYEDANNNMATLGLSGDYSPMLDGSSTPRVFQYKNNARWGFTGFGGDRTVCWNGDSTLNLTNTASGVVSTKLSNTTDTNSLGSAYSTYYAYPACFMFGNRSEFADGTIRFMNPIRYELGQEWDAKTFFESTNHVVAARLMGSLKLGNASKTWYFSGRKFGGYLALEADNEDFTGKVNVYEKGNLLVNSNLVAQAATVESGAGLGGVGSLTTAAGTTVKSGGSLFGGEWDKGGTLTLGGSVTLESGSAIRAEFGSSNDRVGCVKLAAGSTLAFTSPINVDIDTDPDVSPSRGTSQKVFDWSEASGSAPTRADFVARPENNADLRSMFITVRDNCLYVNYVSVRYPLTTILLVK